MPNSKLQSLNENFDLAKEVHKTNVHIQTTLNFEVDNISKDSVANATKTVSSPKLVTLNTTKDASTTNSVSTKDMTLNTVKNSPLNSISTKNSNIENCSSSMETTLPNIENNNKANLEKYSIEKTKSPVKLTEVCMF